MARIHPAHPERLLASPKHANEGRTLCSLARSLSDDFTVFHSVHYTEIDGNRQLPGEIDFVVVNQAGDLVLVEQKNGPLSETSGGLKKVYDSGEKDLCAQIERGRDAVLDQLRDAFAGQIPIDVAVVLYCPDHRVRDVGASGLPREAICDSGFDGGLTGWLEHHLRPGNPGRSETADRVRAWARRVLTLEQDLSAAIHLHDETYRRLSGGITELVQGLEMDPWRLRVQASAGSGKSIAAVEAFRRARKDGRKPLLLCFNSLLGSAMQDALGEDRDVGTFHQWCRMLLESNGGVFDVEGARSGPEYWGRLVDEVIACDPTEPRYDTIILDEAQDFEPEWWELVRFFESDDSPVRTLIFEDPLQDLLGKEGAALEDCVIFRTNAVYRTPQQLGRFMERLLGVDIEWRCPFEGFEPSVWQIGGEADQLSLIAERVEALLETGFRLDQIVLLSMKGRARCFFRDLDVIGEHRLRKFTGGFSPDGAPVFTPGAITAETIYRFKGKQAPAVVLVDFDADRLDSHSTRNLVYCALTRATVACEVIVDSASPWAEACAKALR